MSQRNIREVEIESSLQNSRRFQPLKLTLHPPNLRPQSSFTYDDIEDFSSDDEEITSEEEDNKEPNKNLSHHFKELIEEQQPQKYSLKAEDLKSESIKKFKNSWNNIINKYSKIKDDLESDELDLVTGQIITDNGHLKNLNSVDRNNLKNVNIWREDYEKEEHRIKERNRRHRVKNTRLANLKLDLNKNTKNNQLEFLHGDTLRDVSPTKGSIPTAFHTKEESPTKKRRVLVDDNDDLESLGSDSEEDEYEVNTVKGKNQARDCIDLFNAPILQPFSKTLSSSPTKSTSFSMMRSSPVKNNNLKIEDGLLSIKAVSPSKKSRESTPIKKSRESTPLEFHEFNFLDQSSPNPNTKVKTLENDGVINNESFTDSLLKTKSKSSPPTRDLIDESFTVIDELEFFNINNTTIATSDYSCCFETCKFLTTIKSSYKQHLLNEHSNALYRLGYPIEYKINQNENSNLQANNIIYEQFPIKLKVPKNFEFSINQNRLNNSILFCPILGCGFLTDGGFNEWKDHLFQADHIEYENDATYEKHEIIDLTEESNDNEEKRSNTSNLTIDNNNSNEGYESIDELFK
ncbi:hypothetical protein KGF54_002570 [Candida jiufengensis]|uniref:uncharacterized protein n=1 Tax=Candida jiufengensis TaxID=497108 RepID=UPI0022244C0F|nr:uncharacterized protein KGF54_002570 [Candida jiufengensis]KAI5953199.1 hypothetical protein KGF54_002570 [Candida jiufengensis]